MAAWHAVRVKSRREKLVSMGLRERGFEEFAPTYKRLSRWSDRTKTIEEPLFPGYVFCKVPSMWRSGVLSTPGVAGLVRSGRDFATVAEMEIASLKVLCQSKSALVPWPFLQHGDKIRILRGPFNGVEGTVLTEKGMLRIIVSVEALCRSVAVEVDRHSIQPIPPSGCVQ